MNNVALCVKKNRAWFSTVRSLKNMADLWHCAHMVSVHSLHSVQQWFGFLSDGKSFDMIYGTPGYSQAQLATEFHTTQANAKKTQNC